MAYVWYPSPTASHKSDLLTCTYTQLYDTVRLNNTAGNAREWSAEAANVWETAQALRAAASVVSAVGPGILNIIGTAQGYIRNELPDALAAAIAAAKSIGLNAQAALQADIAYQAAQSKSLIDKVTGGIGGYLSSAGQGLDNIVGSVSGSVGGLINNAGAALGQVTATVGNAVQGTISTVSGAVGAMVASARDGIAGFLDSADTFIREVVTNLSLGLKDAIESVGPTVAGVVSTVRAWIGDLVRNVETGIGGIVDKLNNIPGAVVELGENIVAAFSAGLPPFVADIGKFLADPLQGVIGGFFHNEEPEFLRMADQLYDVIVNNDQAPEFLRTTLVDAKQGGKPVPAIIAAVIIPVVLSGAISAVLMPVLQPAIQAENAYLRPTLLGLGDAVQAMYRGKLTRADVQAQGDRAGYSDAIIEAAIELGRQQPSPIDLAEWRNRQFIPDGVMVERLQALGWSPEDATNILATADIVPNVSDLVRFAVREAFPGQVAFDGPRGSGTPARFIETAKQHGLTPEFARSYWAAHWELPSTTAVFDMFHRRMISETQLRAYLKEADFAPEWVEKIIALSYDPLTRIDVRRMFALGVLSRGEVIDAYQDLGYSVENATRLADFIEADIADSKKVETAVQRDLTRADLVGAYADGILTRPKAKTALVSIGYDDAESELILDREDIRVMRAERKETKAGIVDQVMAGVIDGVTAQDKLTAAGYTSDEILATMREIERKIASLSQSPSKADLDKFRKAEIISEDEYRVELARLGYPPKWVEAYVMLGAVKGA